MSEKELEMDMLEKANYRVKEAQNALNVVSASTLFRTPMFSPQDSKALLGVARDWLELAIKQFQEEKYKESFVSASNSIELANRAYNQAVRILESTMP